MLLFSVLSLTMRKTQQLFASGRGAKQRKLFVYVIHANCMNAKKKIVHGCGPSNRSLAIFVCPFNALQYRWPLDTGSPKVFTARGTMIWLCTSGHYGHLETVDNTKRLIISFK